MGDKGVWPRLRPGRAGKARTHGNVIIALTSPSGGSRRRGRIGHHDVTPIVVGPVHCSTQSA